MHSMCIRKMIFVFNLFKITDETTYTLYIIMLFIKNY